MCFLKGTKTILCYAGFFIVICSKKLKKIQKTMEFFHTLFAFLSIMFALLLGEKNKKRKGKMKEYKNLVCR